MGVQCRKQPILACNRDGEFSWTAKVFNLFYLDFPIYNVTIYDRLVLPSLLLVPLAENRTVSTSTNPITFLLH